MDRCESICLKAVLDKSASQKEAAASLGLSQTKLHRLKKRHHIEKKPRGDVS